MQAGYTISAYASTSLPHSTPLHWDMQTWAQMCPYTLTWVLTCALLRPLLTHMQRAHTSLLVNLHTSAHTCLYAVRGLRQGSQDPKGSPHPQHQQHSVSEVDPQVSQSPGKFPCPLSQGNASLAEGRLCVRDM